MCTLPPPLTHTHILISSPVLALQLLLLRTNLDKMTVLFLIIEGRFSIYYTETDKRLLKKKEPHQDYFKGILTIFSKIEMETYG